MMTSPITPELLGNAFATYALTMQREYGYTSTHTEAYGIIYRILISRWGDEAGKQFVAGVKAETARLWEAMRESVSGQGSKSERATA